MQNFYLWKNSMCQKFHCTKKFAEKFLPMACIGKIGENCLTVKFPRITYGMTLWVLQYKFVVSAIWHTLVSNGI